MVYYICARCNQCYSPCEDECFYTTDFFKSRLYHMTTKPSTIKMQQNIKGDWIEESDILMNIPKPYKDMQIIRYGKFTYDALLQLETARAFKKLKKGSK